MCQPASCMHASDIDSSRNLVKFVWKKQLLTTIDQSKLTVIGQDQLTIFWSVLNRFVEAITFVFVPCCCRPRNKFEMSQKMNIRIRRLFHIEPCSCCGCCCCCWGWLFCWSLFPAVPFWTWLLLCCPFCSQTASSLRSEAMMKGKR